MSKDWLRAIAELYAGSREEYIYVLINREYR